MSGAAPSDDRVVIYAGLAYRRLADRVVATLPQGRPEESRRPPCRFRSVARCAWPTEPGPTDSRGASPPWPFAGNGRPANQVRV
jgi:hypothetical protein